MTDDDTGRPTPSVSVVMAAYGAEATLAAALDALGPQVAACGGEIVIVDDGSTDGTRAVALDWVARHPEVACTVVGTDVNRGLNGARNAAVLHARADFLAFTDSDDTVDPGWLAALVAARRPVAIVAGRYRHRGEAQIRTLRPFYDLDAGTALGTSMAMERSVFDDARGFDESFRVGGDEIEFALRAQIVHGAAFVRAPDAVVEYRIPRDRRGRRARLLRYLRGTALVARRVRSWPGAPDSGFTFRARLRDALGAAVRMVIGGPGGRDRLDSFDRCVVEAWAAAWIARYAVAAPPPRWADPARTFAIYRVLTSSSKAVPGG